MTGYVRRHRVDAPAALAAAEALLADEEEGAGLLWCIEALEHYGQIIGEIGRLAAEHARLRLGADPHAGELETRLAVRHAMLTAVAIFQSAIPFDEDADFFGADDSMEGRWGPFHYQPYDDEVDDYPGLHLLGPWYAADAEGWLDAYWFTVIGDWFALTALIEVPETDLRAAAPSQDEFLFSWISALRALHLADPDAAATALANTRNQLITAQRFEFLMVQQIWLPQLDLAAELIAAHRGEDRSARFNTLLTQALVEHRSYWMAGEDQANNSQGWVSFPLLGLACWAVDLGIAVEVSSEYLPSFFLRERAWLDTSVAEPVPTDPLPGEHAATDRATPLHGRVTKYQVPRDDFPASFAELATLPHSFGVMIAEARRGKITWGLIPLVAMNWAILTCALDSGATREHSKRVIRLAAQAVVEHFLASLQPGNEPVQMVLDDQMFRCRINQESDFWSVPPVWSEAFWMLLITRDRPGLRRLMDTGTDWIPEQEAHGRIRVEALRAALDSPELATNLLQQALRDADLLDPLTRKAWTALNHWPYTLMLVVLAGDEDRFNAELARALKDHKKYWGKKARADDVRGAVSWPLTAIACFAVDRGMRVGVESGYLLTHILRDPTWATRLPVLDAADSLLAEPKSRFCIIEQQDWEGTWVTRHEIDAADATRRAEELRPLVQEALQTATTDSAELGRLLDLAKTRTELLLAADPNAEQADSRRTLLLAIQAGFALFCSARAPEEHDADATLDLDHVAIAWPKRAPAHDFTINRWLTTYWLSRHFRQARGTNALEYFERDASEPPMDAFLLAWLEALRNPYSQDENLPRAIRLAEQSQHTPSEQVEQLYLPQMRLLSLTRSTDLHAVDLAVTAALEGHRTYWSATPERRADSQGFVCWPVLGITGGHGNVRSEYLPQAITDHQWRDVDLRD